MTAFALFVPAKTQSSLNSQYLPQGRGKKTVLQSPVDRTSAYADGIVLVFQTIADLFRGPIKTEQPCYKFYIGRI